jgi:hypothetical protein
MVFAQRFKIENSRHISELTGGETAAFKYGRDTFARLDETTRSQYLLGYSPTDSEWDGTYRNVRVTVNRPGVRVLYRHGYYGREQWTPPDRRTFLTFSRIAAAAKYPQPIEDISLTIEDASVGEADGRQFVTATGRIAASDLAFSTSGALHVASLDAVFACVDGKDRTVGDVTRTLEFKLTEENYQRYMRDGVPFAIRVPVTGQPVRLKAVVYDYDADAVGSRTARVKR